MTRLRAVALDELWAGELATVRVGGTGVVLLRSGDGVHAYLDRCPHLGVPLSRGRLTGHVLTCAAHQWQYDVRTGDGINPATARLVRVPASVMDGWVWVDVSAAPMARDVGPVLEANEVGSAIADVIADTHPGTRVLDRGAYVRVCVPGGRCVLRASDVEARIGRAFALPGDLEKVMPSFEGSMRIEGDEVVWALRGR